MRRRWRIGLWRHLACIAGRRFFSYVELPQLVDQVNGPAVALCTKRNANAIDRRAADMGSRLTGALCASCCPAVALRYMGRSRNSDSEVVCCHALSFSPSLEIFSCL